MNIEALIDRLAQAVVDRLTPAPKAKPKPRPAPTPHVETELERVQRDFEWLREHGGVMAEGRFDRATGEIHWR